MKQPIAGIAGLKPRALKPEGDGRLSKQESRALDREYGVQRNETLRLKNFREAMLLAKARGELIERRLVEFQAAHLLIAMRQRALAVPQASPAGCWAWPMRTKRARSFAAMIELLDELKDLPARVTDASWIERAVEEQGAVGQPVAKAGKQEAIGS